MQPDKNHEELAKQHFFIINAMRVIGVFMVIFGLLILSGTVKMTALVAYIFIPLGLIEAFVTPQYLARMWSSGRNE